jgi:hypothetical protein
MGLRKARGVRRFVMVYLLSGFYIIKSKNSFLVLFNNSLFGEYISNPLSFINIYD